MIDWITWFYYFLYMQSGLLVGAGLARKLAPGKKNGMSELKYGEWGRFAVGIGLSFGLQMYNVEYVFVWTCSTVVSAAWSFYPTMLIYAKEKLNELKSNKGLGRQVKSLVSLIEALTVLLGWEISFDDFTKECKNKTAAEVVEYLQEKVTKKSEVQLSDPEDIVILAEMTA